MLLSSLAKQYATFSKLLTLKTLDLPHMSSKSILNNLETFFAG